MSKQEKAKTQEFYIKGLGLETVFAVRRLLDKYNVTTEDVFVTGIFGNPCNATTHTRLNKKGIVHSGISGEFKLGKNPWNITSPIIITINSNETNCVLPENSNWKLFQQELQEEANKGTVLRGSSFGISSSGITFFEGQKNPPIFSEGLENQLEYSIYSHIDTHADLRPGEFRRGVLLSGTYGTGKSSTAAYISHRANEMGITFVYVSDPANFSRASRILSSLGKTIVFVEDVDRLFEGERDGEVDGILNSMDGVDSKAEDVMHIFTTNNLDIIERAFLRPGRIDSIIEMELPNKQATTAILQRYLGESSGNVIPSYVEQMQGSYTPAVLREITVRAKIRARKYNRSVLPEDLIAAESSMERQVRLVESMRKPKEEDHFSTAVEKVLRKFL